YIAYSELSEFYRCWLGQHHLGGAPLLPEANNPEQAFGTRFGRSLAAATARLALGRPIAFTFHATSSAAWNAVGMAIDRGDLLVTGLWPVWNDSHMGHHAADGNCEWDLILACRREGECVRQACDVSVDRLAQEIE